jgi:hypothetical protein
MGGKAKLLGDARDVFAPALARQMMRARSTCRAGAVREWASRSTAACSSSVSSRSRNRRMATSGKTAPIIA